MADDAKVKLTGLWKNTSKSGKTYYSGRLGMAKLLVFENNNKRSNKDPDLTIYLTEWQERGEGGGGGSKAPDPEHEHPTTKALVDSFFGGKAPAPVKEREPGSDDDDDGNRIPF